uniref:Protein spinster homolog 3-like n=1 Tax=Gouania willdenowi TaxID=441366 RepID=A0A8C5GII7_GOUWI
MEYSETELTSFEPEHTQSLNITRFLESPQVIPPKRAYIAVAVLCYINLLNYMERYTVAGVLSIIQTVFALSDSTAGLLQTMFIVSLSLLAPVFGYFGDRYNRKHIIIGGLIVWFACAAGSSFVGPSHFWLLVLLRSLVGVGEASYSTLAPTIIADLFTGSKRSLIICIFYICIPVGSGLGYITGAGTAALTRDWRWALRVTTLSLKPFLFQLGVSRSDIDISLKTNICYRAGKSSGVTALAFLTGALAFWMPTFLSRAHVTQGIRPPCTNEPCDPTDSLIFGVVTVATGIIGGVTGSALSRHFRDKMPNADPFICVVGMIGSVPCLFITIFVASASIPATYVFIFIGELLLSLNWAVLADMLLYVVMPTRRATAEALQIIVGHLLGDAGSPFLLGVISDAIHASRPESSDWSFHSLQYSLLLLPFVGILGGVFFLFASFYVAEDRNAVQQLLTGLEIHLASSLLS